MVSVVNVSLASETIQLRLWYFRLELRARQF